MANQARKISVVSGAGLLTQVWIKLDAEVRQLSGEKAVDYLYKLSTDEGESTIRALAKIIVSSCNQPSLPGLVSDHQMKALEYYISKSRDATEYAKEAVIWALRQTNNLTRNIAVSFLNVWDEKKANEIATSVHDMGSSGGSTLLQTFFKAMDIQRSISFHGGYYPLNG